MTDWLRPTLALLALFGGWAFICFWLGVPGAAGFAFAITFILAAIGIATGYWIGFDETADKMVAELMRRLRERRKETSGHH